MTQLSADNIKTALCNSWGEDHSVYKEPYLGAASLGARRVDVAALEHTWKPPNIKIAEVKISRPDFLNDKKYTEYMSYCNEFYWACPTGLISREEVGDKHGLIMINPDTLSATTVKRAVYRDVDPTDKFMLLYYILTWRHSSVKGVARDQRVARIQREIKQNREVGERYSRYVSEQLDVARRKVEKAKRAQSRAEERAETARVRRESMEEQCREANEMAGIMLDKRPNMTPDELRAMVDAIPYNMEFTIRDLRQKLKTMEQAIGGCHAE